MSGTSCEGANNLNVSTSPALSLIKPLSESTSPSPQQLPNESETSCEGADEWIESIVAMLCGSGSVQLESGEEEGEREDDDSVGRQDGSMGSRRQFIVELNISGLEDARVDV